MSDDWFDARYEGCTTGAQIEGRILWLRVQEVRDIDASRHKYEQFWIAEIMKKFPLMPYRDATREFFTNGTWCLDARNDEVTK